MSSDIQLGLNLKFFSPVPFVPLPFFPFQFTTQAIDRLAYSEKTSTLPSKTGPSKMVQINAGKIPSHSPNKTQVLENLSRKASRSAKSTESRWGSEANCYAYAMGCKNPQDGSNGGAKPGAIHGLIVNPLGPENAKEYRDSLIKGASLDGATQVEGNLDSPPKSKPGTYLVALICDNTGFHWLKRNEKKRTWSWKDGNGDTVKDNVYNVKSQSYTKIKDGTKNNLATLVDDPSKYAGWRYGKMQFVSFFSVPDSGCIVAGQPKTNSNK